MRKKVCTRPQCGKEYFEGEGYDALTVCTICGAALDEILVEDSEVVDTDSEVFDDVIDGDYEVIDDMNDYKEDSEDNVPNHDEASVREEAGHVEEKSENDNKEAELVDIHTMHEESGEDSENTDKDDKGKYDEGVDTESKDESPAELAEDPVNEDDENSKASKEDIDGDKEELEDNNDGSEEDGGEEKEEEESEEDDEDDEYDEIKGNNLIFYKGNEIYKVYELKYDETVIGRNSSEFTPDIDLHELDINNETSRKHLLVYKEDGKYYARNISRKCSVHIKRANQPQAKPLLFGGSCILEDGDFIVLSGKFIIEAYLEDTAEE